MTQVAVPSLEETMAELVRLLVDCATRDGKSPTLEDVVRSLDEPEVLRAFQAMEATGALSGMDRPAHAVMETALAGFVARGKTAGSGQSVLAVRAQKTKRRKH